MILWPGQMLNYHLFSPFRYAHFTNEQLRELISKDSIVHVTRRRPPKSRLIASESEKCKLRMRQDLEMHLLDGIALVSWDKETGEVTGKMFCLCVRACVCVCVYTCLCLDND